MFQRCLVMALANGIPTIAQARSTTTQLNFVAVNQSPWAAGNAFVVKDKFLIPDPHFKGDVSLPTTSFSPTGALLDFLGVGGIGDIKAAANASFAAGLTATYHINGGELDISYPQEVRLNLPDRIPVGTFQVSAEYAHGGVDGPPWATSARSVDLGFLTTKAGAGYAQTAFELQSTLGRVDQVASLSARFPYAEARLDLDVKASGNLKLEGCVLLCFDIGTLEFGKADFSQQILEASTISGVKVLNQPFVEFGKENDIGWANLTVHSPYTEVKGTLRTDKSLRGTTSKDVLDFGFDAEQLIPILGKVLHGELGPFEYQLLALKPHAVIGIYQNFSFEPELWISLEFSQPVLHNGKFTNKVEFKVGDAVDLEGTLPSGFDLDLSAVTVKPTYFLRNKLHNKTGLVLTARLEVDALKLEVPIEIGPAYNPPPFDLFDIYLPLFDKEFQVNINPITGKAVTLQRDAELEPFLNVSMANRLDEGGGKFSYDFSIDDLYIGGFSGVEVFVPGTLGDLPLDHTLFIADSSIDLPDELDYISIGKQFCIDCGDLSSFFSPTSPSVLDTYGELFLTDLSTFNVLPSVDEVLASDSDLANTNFFLNSTLTDARFIRAVPEPAPFFFFGPALILLALCRAALQAAAGCQPVRAAGCGSAGQWPAIDSKHMRRTELTKFAIVVIGGRTTGPKRARSGWSLPDQSVHCNGRRRFPLHHHHSAGKL